MLYSTSRSRISLAGPS
uniref:Uncharacterized protein n=1 Tax=Arundo donax TaxID=35708 RepID=A0A0A9FA08_ARUDO